MSDLRYASITSLNLGSVPDVDDPVVYQALLDIHNALEILLQSKDTGDETLREELTLNIPLNPDESAILAEVTNFPEPEPHPTELGVHILSPLETSDRGSIGVPVFLQDQTTDILNLYFLQTKATGLTLAAPTSAESRVITLAAGHGLTTANSFGHILEISSTTSGRYYQGEIISITGDVVTLDTPVGNIFTVANSVVGTGNHNLVKDTATGAIIDGSVTPVIFKVAPLPTQSGDMTKVIIAMQSANESDMSTFGGAPALTVGLTLRVKRADGSYKNIFNFKDNFDMVLPAFDYATYNPKVGNSIRGFLAMISFAGQENQGVAIRLDGSLGEELQVVINELMVDAGAGNTLVSLLARGSELQGN